METGKCSCKRLHNFNNANSCNDDYLVKVKIIIIKFLVYVMKE